MRWEAPSAFVLLAIATLPLPIGGQTFEIGSRPTASIGGEVELFHVEDIAFYQNRLAVVNAGSQEVLFFSPAGNLLERFGRSGAGPGEFRGLSDLHVCGGDLVIWDRGLDRITVYEGSDRFETFQIPPLAERLPQGVSCSDSRLVASYRVTGRKQISPGPYRPTFHLHEFSLDGMHRGFIREVPGDARYRHDTSDGPQVLGKLTVLLATQEGVLLGTGDAFEFRHFPAGHDEPSQIFRVPYELEVIPNAHVTHLQQQGLERAKAYGTSVVARLKESQSLYQYPEFYPPYSKAMIVDDRELWVKYYPKFPTENEKWEVFDMGSGERLNTVVMPEGFAAMAIAGGQLAGVWKDELDVEWIRVYDLVRETGGT